MRIEIAGVKHLVELASFVVKPGITQNRITVSEEVEQRIGGVPGVKLNEEVNQYEAGPVRQQHRRPERHPWAVTEQDDESD
jgi:hypothetical protein